MSRQPRPPAKGAPTDGRGLMPIRVTLPETGAQLTGDLRLPAISIGRGPRPQPEVSGKALAAAMIPQVAAAIEPLLPKAAPAHPEVRRDPDGRITGTAEYPATPAPVIRAGQIAKLLAPSIAAVYSSAISAEYRAFDAAQARAAVVARVRKAESAAKAIEARLARPKAQR